MPRLAPLVALLLLLAVAASAGPQAPDAPPRVPADSTPAQPTPVPDHEALVLAGLEQNPNASAIAVRAKILQFPLEQGQSLVAVVADLPTSGPTLQRIEGDQGGYSQDFTVVALIRDEAGTIVHRLSRHYALSWPEQSLDEVKEGRVLFAREAILGPGRYSVEVATRDARDGRMGVAHLSLDLPRTPDDLLRVSSLMIVGHSAPQAAEESSPLLYEGVRLYPNLGDTVTLGEGDPLSFLFTLRPGARPLAAATVELLRDGETILQSSVGLPRPDLNGQMRVVSGLPLRKVPPGPYVLHLSVNNAQGLQSRSEAFTLAP